MFWLFSSLVLQELSSNASDLRIHQYRQSTSLVFLLICHFIWQCNAITRNEIKAGKLTFPIKLFLKTGENRVGV